MNNTSKAYKFLNKLAGKWKLTGKMGDIPLEQDVLAKPVLGGLFIEMNFSSTLLSSNSTMFYEAIYLIGYNEKEDSFIMNLFDTFGVSLNPVPGIGRRNNNSVEFVFNYDAGPFTNKMSYDESLDEWKFVLSYKEENAVKTFAVKKMSRAG